MLLPWLPFFYHCYHCHDQHWGHQSLLWGAEDAGQQFFCPRNVCYEPKPLRLSLCSLFLFLGRAEGAGGSRGRLLPARPGLALPGSLEGTDAEMPPFTFRSSFSLLSRVGLGKTSGRRKISSSCCYWCFLPTPKHYCHTFPLSWGLFCWGQRGHRCRGWAVLKSLEMKSLALAQKDEFESQLCQLQALCLSFLMWW